MEEHTSRISFSMELTGKIIMAAIFILFFIIVFVLILQLYSRWILSRIVESTPARRRSHQQSAVAASKKGLDAAVLRSIPVVVFSPEDFKEGLECAVCLSELVQGEKARLLPPCNHGFHVDCIDMWFKSNSTCPLCRNPVAPNSSDLESGSSMESPIFPTNILFWGNQMQISSRGVFDIPNESLEEPQTAESHLHLPPAPAPANIKADGMVVIDIPNEPSSSSSRTGAGGCSGDEDMKSVVTTRLRTLKRLLSGERRIGNNQTSLDLEQVERGQS